MCVRSLSENQYFGLHRGLSIEFVQLKSIDHNWLENPLSRADFFRLYNLTEHTIVDKYMLHALPLSEFSTHMAFSRIIAFFIKSSFLIQSYIIAKSQNVARRYHYYRKIKSLVITYYVSCFCSISKSGGNIMFYSTTL